MLVQSRPGSIQLLPALPSQLSSGEIRGVLAQSQIEIKRLKWSPGHCTVVVRSRPQQSITITMPRDIAAVQSGKALVTQSGSRTFQLVLPANEDVEVSVATR
jgi:hypothetical protein